jgi:hypothetical protein
MEPPCVHGFLLELSHDARAPIGLGERARLTQAKSRRDSKPSDHQNPRRARGEFREFRALFSIRLSCAANSKARPLDALNLTGVINDRRIRAIDELTFFVEDIRRNSRVNVSASCVRHE